MKESNVTQKRIRKATTKRTKAAVRSAVPKAKGNPRAAGSKTPVRRGAETASVQLASEDVTAADAKRSSLERVVQSEWIELFPQGISVSTEMGRPVLILKDKNGINVLPVWIQPLDAGVALAELSQGTGATPHAVARHLLAELGLRIESCTFTDLIGHHQYAQLTFCYESDSKVLARSSESAPVPPQVHTLRVRADEAMSFCLQGKARFYSTQSFMARCRALDEDLSKLEQNMVHGLLPGLAAEAEMSSKKHTYVM